MSSTGRTLQITPLLPWRPAILSALLDLTTLGDVDAHLLVVAGGQIVAVFAAKADDVDDAGRKRREAS